MRKDFPEICFDACIFPPNLKRIPEDAATTALSYTSDFFAQYKEWYKAAVKASKAAFDQAQIIEKLEADLAQKSRIVDILQSEAESSRKAEVESLKKVDETLVEMAKMQQAHCTLVEDLGHRYKNVESERDAAVKELEELKAKFADMNKEKDDANVAAQEACEQAVSFRAERDAAIARVKEVESEVEERVQAERLKMETEFDDLLDTYNANVLERRNLSWLGDYSMPLYNAWKKLVENKRMSCPDGVLDEFELESRLLSEDERRTLHEAIISVEKERLGVHQTEVGEGSGIVHHSENTKIPVSTSSEVVAVVDPQAIPAYNPDQPELSSGKTLVPELVQAPRQGKVGILITLLTS